MTPPALRRCVVVGGAGAVGAMFVDLLLSCGAEVTVVDIRACAGTRLVRGDVTAPGSELVDEIGAADLVVLAVPEPVALAAVPGVASAMRSDALLVDTLSVKGRIVAAARSAGADVEVLSLNPMFAPSLGIEGRPVAAVVVRDGPRARELLRLIEVWGGRVVLVSEADHDRLAGATQALTHAAVLAFGLALADLDVGIAELTSIAPPPHATMLALLARIVSGAPEVYWDVQSANPHAPAARRALADAARRLADLVDHGGEADFAAVLDRLRMLLGPELAHYGALCARSFEATTGTAPI